VPESFNPINLKYKDPTCASNGKPIDVGIVKSLTYIKDEQANRF